MTRNTLLMMNFLGFSVPLWRGYNRIDDPADHECSLGTASARFAPAGSVNGSGNVFVLKDVGQEAFLAARYRLAKFNVEIAEKHFTGGNTDYSAGSWILP